MRRLHLTNGRRVRISDLVEAGLLGENDEVHFARRNRGEKHLAVIRKGQMVLEDGRSFGTPSRAAAVVTGTPYDGWHAWRTGDEELLDSLRQRFLDLEVEEPASPSSDRTDPAEGELYHFLRGARADAGSGRPVNIPVRQLIGKWGFDRRSQMQAEHVRAELENFGLRTDPDFVKVSLDERVELRQKPTMADIETDANEETPVEADGSNLVEVEGAQNSQEDAGAVAVTARANESADEVGLTLGNLVSPDVDLVSARPDAELSSAITKMQLNDFSQIPVISGRNLYGAVTWESIARALMGKGAPSVRAATVPVTFFPYDTDLIDALDAIRIQGFVLVQNAHRLFSGIVTASDVVAAYEELATPYFLVGELDLLLRRLTMEVLLPDEAEGSAISDRLGIASLDKLSFGDYQSVLGRSEYWSRIGWTVDRSDFIKRLDELRERRNDVMHFSPDPVPAEVIRHLRAMISLVKGLGLSS